uniref:hypothetical protein n=1 Tax=Vibrio cholerae TaxID=666 RepID=UPI001C10A389
EVIGSYWELLEVIGSYIIELSQVQKLMVLKKFFAKLKNLHSLRSFKKFLLRQAAKPSKRTIALLLKQ